VRGHVADDVDRPQGMWREAVKRKAQEPRHIRPERSRQEARPAHLFTLPSSRQVGSACRRARCGAIWIVEWAVRLWRGLPTPGQRPTRWMGLVSTVPCQPRVPPD
jgi:hypothetical protein